METIKVAAGILLDSAGRVLITERLGDSPFAGLWEFPGGKIGSRETPAVALRRELAEEVGVDIEAYESFMSVDHRYADRRVSIAFFLVTRWLHEPRSLEGQGMRWVQPGRIDGNELMPADLPVLDKLRLKLTESGNAEWRFRRKY
jgi:8-oxo-dGTP diphosphatase